MARPSPLKVLVNLAEHRSQDVARTLGQLVGHGEQGEAKLQLLRNYLQEYRARLDEAILEGIDGERLRNYLAFIARLEHAIADQVAEVARAQARIAQQRERWLEQERERRIFETLLARRQLETKRLEARREQNQLDELSSGAHVRRSNRTTI